MKQLESLCEDESLVLLLRENAQDAFTKIYNKYFSMLYTLSFRYLQEREPAEDIVQQIFLQLWENRLSGRIMINLKNYLYTMTKNHLLNMIRNQNSLMVRICGNVQQQNEMADDGLQEKLEEERRLCCFYKAVKRLPGSKREICLLKIQEGLSNQEIAEKLNMPVGTVKNYYTQSIRALKYNLKHSY